MRRILLCLFCGILLLAPCARAEDNLLINPGFEQTHDGWPLGWEQDMWLFDTGASYLELAAPGRESDWCVLVENVVSNDARFVQSAEVLPETVYRLSGYIKVDSVGPDGAGANISVLSSYESFPMVYDTQGQWRYVECYIRTAEGQEQLSIAVRLGGYSADNIGKAWFDDIALTPVDAVPEDAAVIQLTDYTRYAGQQTVSDADTDSSSLGLLAGIGGFLAVLAVLYFARRARLPWPRAALAGLLAVAAALRLYLMATQAGYATDMQCFYAWAQRMAAVGPGEFYADDYFCDYLPGYLYLLWPIGGLMNLLGVVEMNATARVLVKLMPMLADLGIVVLLWRMAQKPLQATGALLVAALYAFSPAVLIDSAVWGQVDSLLALGLVATVALVQRKNWRAALPVFALTFLCKPQALLAAPVGVAALAADILREKTPSARRKIIAHAAQGLGIAVAGMVLLLLPFVWGKPVTWTFEKILETLSSYPYATLNTANLYYLLGANWVGLEASFLGISYGTFGTVMMVLCVAGVLVLYWTRRDAPEALPLCGALLYTALYLLGVKMHERYLYPALALWLVAYLRRRDARLLVLFAGFSMTFFVNCALVLRDTHLALGFGVPGCVLAVCNLLLLALAIWTAVDRRTCELPAPSAGEHAAARAQARVDEVLCQTPPLPRMRKRDWAVMLSLTLVYTAIAYIGLGSTSAPQTYWISTGTDEQITFDLGETRDFSLIFYQGVLRSDFAVQVELSDDGTTWSPLPEYTALEGNCFRWMYDPTAHYDTTTGEFLSWLDTPGTYSARYVRLRVNYPGYMLMELGFLDAQGEVIPALVSQWTGAREGSSYTPEALVDEQDTVMSEPSYYNGTYFDEIYHARTGYEHANGLLTYEWTHPPLGKIFIMWGIELFGMTPFGWRFFGTLMGVLMVPAMYLLGKLFFRKTRYAFLTAFVMAFDMMHLTQTRIATIDSYAVLFILLMYLCMFRFLQMNLFRDRWRAWVPLALSGVFMGLGCASKWICMYAGVGLAVLFFWSMARHLLQWTACRNAGGEAAQKVRDYPKLLLGTLAVCVVCFLAIPFAIYYFSYIPHFAYEGGLTWERFWNTQVNMFNYHATLADNHAFQSPWYEWPLMLKPMYYYNGSPFVGEGNVATIMCMGNPAVWWTGFATMLYLLWRWLRPHVRGEAVRDHRPAMLLLAFLAQFLPWVLVPRSMFIYHYFGSLPFVMLSIVYAAQRVDARLGKRALPVWIGYMAVTVLLFIGFYPIGTGTEIPRAWADAMNWFSNLYLPGWQYRGWLYY